jgi:regulatory protein
VIGAPSARRRGPDSRRGARRPAPPGQDDPLNPDVVPGPPEDELGDPETAARGICLRALTGTPKTRQQLADLLAKRGVPDDAAQTVLERFVEVGLIDDAAFARAWVSSRQAGRGLARRALSAELRAKGVEPEVAAEAVSEVDDDDERVAARRLVERRLGAMRRLDRATATRRLMGMLARKGYNGGLAAAVIREAFDSAGADGVAGDEFDRLDEDSLLP